jgi:hypothetical protein
MSKVIYCAMCTKEIKEGDFYWHIGDNFLQANYFDADIDNVFCSEDCMLESLSAIEEEYDGSFGEDEE